MTVATAHVTLRPVAPGDEELLFRVYASTREEELAQVPWTDEAKLAFLRSQFAAQDAHYRAHYDGAGYDVVLVAGRPAGRLYVARWDDEIRIMDVALLPEFRGHGIGTELLLEVLEEAASSRKRVTVHVEKHNPALALYERLGFVAVADRGVYLLLEASPPAADPEGTR